MLQALIGIRMRLSFSLDGSRCAGARNHNITAAQQSLSGVLPSSEVSHSLGHAREFVPVRCQPGNTLHFRLVENQQHEDVIGDIPLALDSMIAGGSESESGIVVGVAHNNNKWAARVLEFSITRFDQFTPDSLALAFWKYAIGPSAAPVILPPTDSGLYIM
jgi:hypothetical protein